MEIDFVYVPSHCVYSFAERKNTPSTLHLKSFKSFSQTEGKHAN